MGDDDEDSANRIPSASPRSGRSISAPAAHTGMAARPRARGGILVERDLEILAWLARLGAVSVQQIAARFGLGRTQAYRRLQVLADHGLIFGHRILAERPMLYAPRACRLSPATFEHTFALAELVVARELAGAVVVSETELRRERAERRLDSRLGERQWRTLVACPRLPDVVEALGGGGLLAWEIELSSKGRRRREAAISAYAASAYERVAWICPEPRLRAFLAAEIEGFGLGGFMEVSAGPPT
jgi:DNA-binding Lrp family transcriptional regulator